MNFWQIFHCIQNDKSVLSIRWKMSLMKLSGFSALNQKKHNKPLISLASRIHIPPFNPDEKPGLRYNQQYNNVAI